jgi:hypothetical protein
VEPADDLVLEVDAAGPGFGFYAEDAYRFGRPGKTMAPLDAEGPSLKIGGVDLGSSVVVEP